MCEEENLEAVSGRGNSACKGPEAGACLVRMRNSEDTGVAGAGHGGKSGDEVRGSRQSDLNVGHARTWFYFK